MKDEYDFSKAERGKFYRPDVSLDIPIHLDDANRAFVEKIAAKKNKDVETVVNELLASDRHLAELID